MRCRTIGGDFSGRVAGNYRVARKRLGCHGTRADDDVVSQRDAFEDHGIRSDELIVTLNNGFRHTVVTATGGFEQRGVHGVETLPSHRVDVTSPEP